MPPAIYTQSTIALIWDFDKTLTHGYMQEPLFAEFGVDPSDFWREVNALSDYYKSLTPPAGPALVGKDTIYLNHILTYVRDGTFANLTNAKLRELGKQVQLAQVFLSSSMSSATPFRTRNIGSMISASSTTLFRPASEP